MRRFSPLYRSLCIAVCLLAPIVTAFAAKDMTASEIDFKADFIMNLIDDVTWPDKAPKEADGSVVIGVIGDSPLTAAMTRLAQARKSGTKVTVKVFGENDDLTKCRILFMATEDKTELASILKRVRNAPVLTVSDAYYFARYGVMVNFYTEEDNGKEKVKFEVNTMTMGFVGIKMKSTLLELATVI